METILLFCNYSVAEWSVEPPIPRAASTHPWGLAAAVLATDTLCMGAPSPTG